MAFAMTRFRMLIIGAVFVTLELLLLSSRHEAANTFLPRLHTSFSTHYFAGGSSRSAGNASASTEPIKPEKKKGDKADDHKADSKPGKGGDAAAPFVRKAGDVVLVTASSGKDGFPGIAGLKQMVYENRMSYAARHNYDFMWANMTSYDFGPKRYWNKIPVLKDAFARHPNAEWVWWLDFDAIIMTPSRSLHSMLLSPQAMRRQLMHDEQLKSPQGLIPGVRTVHSQKPEDINFIISQDYWGLNVGSFLLRRSDWSDWLLDVWADPLATSQDWTFPEQDGFLHMFKNHDVVRNHTGLVTQHTLNSYPFYAGLGDHWEQGDLVVHFAGCGAGPDCPDHWHEMWNHREPYEIPHFVSEQLAAGTAPIEGVQRVKTEAEIKIEEEIAQAEEEKRKKEEEERRQKDEEEKKKKEEEDAREKAEAEAKAKEQEERIQKDQDEKNRKQWQGKPEATNGAGANEPAATDAASSDHGAESDAAKVKASIEEMKRQDEAARAHKEHEV